MINHEISPLSHRQDTHRNEINRAMNAHRRETLDLERTWYRRVEEGLVFRHEKRDDNEQTPREDDHPGSIVDR